MIGLAASATTAPGSTWETMAVTLLVAIAANKNMGNNHFFVKVDLITSSNLSISNSQKEKYKV